MSTCSAARADDDICGSVTPAPRRDSAARKDGDAPLPAGALGSQPTSTCAGSLTFRPFVRQAAMPRRKRRPHWRQTTSQVPLMSRQTALSRTYGSTHSACKQQKILMTALQINAQLPMNNRIPTLIAVACAILAAPAMAQHKYNPMNGQWERRLLANSLIIKEILHFGPSRKWAKMLKSYERLWRRRRRGRDSNPGRR